MIRYPAALILLATLLPAQIRFSALPQEAGLSFHLRNGAAGNFHLVELMPGGVAAFDYNNDGCTDVYFTNGAAFPGLQKTGPEFHNRLFRNNCNLTFSDVTEKAAVSGAGYSMAVATADYDNDGFADLFVAGVNRNSLFRNRGDGTFEDVSKKAGLDRPDPVHGKMWSISAGWFDADNDGHLDLFISNYVGWDAAKENRCGTRDTRFYCHPDNYPGRPHQLFRNRGDGTFDDISQSSGISRHAGKGMGVSLADFNHDGRIDVFVANDSLRSFLFMNKGAGRFSEVGIEYGVSFGEQGRAIAGMGTDFRDYDNDGLPDVIVTGMVNDGYLVFRNTGAPQYFEDFTIRTGLASVTRQLTGWSMGLFDFDNDGWKDLFFANSHFPQLSRYLGVPSPLANSVFRNLGNGRFEDVSRKAGQDLQAAAYWRGTAFADFNSDGKLDVVVTAINAPARLFLNVSEASGNWLALRLRGSVSNRDGIGAAVKLTLPGGRQLYNHVTTSVGYASSSEPHVRFGLGPHKSADIEVVWPSGTVQKVRNLPAGLQTILEPAAKKEL